MRIAVSSKHFKFPISFLWNSNRNNSCVLSIQREKVMPNTRGGQNKITAKWKSKKRCFFTTNSHQLPYVTKLLSSKANFIHLNFPEQNAARIVASRIAQILNVAFSFYKTPIVTSSILWQYDEEVPQHSRLSTEQNHAKIKTSSRANSAMLLCFHSQLSRKECKKARKLEAKVRV